MKLGSMRKVPREEAISQVLLLGLFPAAILSVGTGRWGGESVLYSFISKNSHTTLLEPALFRMCNVLREMGDTPGQGQQVSIDGGTCLTGSTSEQYFLL